VLGNPGRPREPQALWPTVTVVPLNVQMRHFSPRPATGELSGIRLPITDVRLPLPTNHSPLIFPLAHTPILS
jgi:hypothetical protein